MLDKPPTGIRVFQNLSCRRLEVHEIWGFVGAKAKNASPEQKAAGAGDAWFWVATDADTKLVPVLARRRAGSRLGNHLYGRSRHSARLPGALTSDGAHDLTLNQSRKNSFKRCGAKAVWRVVF
jgi:hypothetical protein